MKKIILFLLGITLTATVFSQKAKSKETPPSQKEMEELMKQAQKEMDQLSPEEKRIMDSMGIKMPNFKNTPKVSNAKLANAWEDENRIVPKRDASRIASIAPTPSSSTALSALLNTINSKVQNAVSAETRKLGDQVIANLNGASVDEKIGNTAVGLLLMGKNELAIYIMSKAVGLNVNNASNLHNYAAMLSMNNGQQYSLPILNYLNKKYPNNPRILNEIGQAWFGLGNIELSQKYLDSTIRFGGFHPQATLTKALIEESKGNKQTAISLLKASLKQTYSEAKVARLRKLGYEVGPNDVNLPEKKKADLLNLGSFRIPEFPKSVEESIVAEQTWANFRQQIVEESNSLMNRYVRAAEAAANANKARINRDIKVATGQTKNGRLTSLPLYANEADIKMKSLVENGNSETIGLKIAREKLVSFVGEEGLRLVINYNKTIEELNKKESDQTGDGLENKDFCYDKKAASDKFLSAYNGKLQLLAQEYLTAYKNQLNETAYYLMYAEWEEDYTASLLKMKLEWLNELKMLNNFRFQSITQYNCDNDRKKPEKFKLGNFDSANCEIDISLTIGIITANFTCDRLKTAVSLGMLKVELLQDITKETLSDQFLNCTVEFGPKFGQTLREGKIEIAAEAGFVYGVEINRNGIQDVYMTSSASVSAGGVLDAGVEAKVSLMTGAQSVSGTGIFGE